MTDSFIDVHRDKATSQDTPDRCSTGNQTVDSAVLEASNGKYVFTPDEVLEVIGIHRKQVLMMVIGGLSYAEYNIQLMVQSLSAKSMWNEWPRLANTLTFNWLFFSTGIAKMIGAACLPPLQDRYGRRKVLLTALLVTSALTVISAVMPTFASHVFIRCLVYFTLSSINCSVYVYQMEMVHMKSRTLPPLITQMCGTAGLVFIISVWWGLASIEKSWRYVELISIAPALLAALILLTIFPYESPRFECARGREKEAWSLFGQLTSGGEEKLAAKLNVPSTQLCHISTSHVGILRKSQRNVLIQVLSEVGRGFKRMGNLLVTANAAKYIIPCFLIWFIQALAYWGVTSYLPSFYDSIGLDSHLAVLLTLVCEFPGMIVAYFMMNMKPSHGGGRLWTLRIFSIGSSLVLAMFAIAIKVLPRFHKFLYFPTTLTYFFAAPIWTVLYTYTPEIFATDVRGTAMSLMGIANGIPTVITFFIGSQLSSGWTYPAVWSGAFALLCLIAVIGLHHETVRQPLGELHARGDAKSANSSTTGSPTASIEELGHGSVIEMTHVSQ